MKSTLRLNAKIFPVIALLAFIMQIIDPSRVWVILLVSIGGIWLVCRWWVRGLQRSLVFEREMRFGWAHVGDRLEERFTLTNSFMLPATWVTLQDHSTLPDHHASMATGVDGSSVSQWKVNTQCTRRGVFTLGGTSLETGDPFGIYTLTMEDPTSTTLAVMPPVVALPKFQILSSGWAGEGRTNPRSLEETINASHTREMVPNDPMRWIHWKSTARHEKFFVRQFEGMPAGDRWVLLDLDQETALGSGWESTEEHSVVIAASLSAQELKEEHPVGLAVNGSQPSWTVPRRNEYQLKALLKELAVASPSPIGLQDYLHRIGPSLSSRSSLLVVTANASPGWTASLVPLMWRGVRPTVFLLDPLSFGGSMDTRPICDSLQAMDIPCHVIPREMLDKQQLWPGSEGEWEWRVSGTGKAIAVKAPVADWRRLE
ncbi:MAG: DUF58 domain-containing protein [Bacteroidota bacterium]